MKAFFVGSLGVLVMAAILALVYLAWDTHRMAQRGDAAAAFIEQQLQKAQQQQPAK